MNIHFPSDGSFHIHGPGLTGRESPQEIQGHGFKGDVAGALRSEGDFLQIGKQVIALADSRGMGIGKSIQGFQEKYKSNLQRLTSEGWKEVKTDLKEKMAVDSGKTPSFQTMRKEYVDLVQQSCLKIVGEMGYEDPGRFSAEGTPGWDSDIDTVYIAPEGMGEEEAIAVQTLFNALSATITEVKGQKASILSYTDSATSFDTECYLQAGKHNTEELVKTPEGRASFSKLELVAAHTQLTALMGQHEEVYEEIKQRRLSSAPEVLQATLSQSFADCEALQKEVELGIEEMFNKICAEQGIHPEKLSKKEFKELESKVARVFKKECLYALSQKMDVVTGKIEACEASIRMSQEKQIPIDALEKTHDQLQAERANLQVVRNVLFPESYHALGSFLEVVAYSKGQSWQRSAEQASSRISEVLDSPYEAQREGGFFKLSASARLEPSAANRVASMQENLAMYHVHFLENVAKAQPKMSMDQKHMQSLVSTSKYMQRVMQSATELLTRHESDFEEPSKVYGEALGSECRQGLFVASELEKCKRKKVLNETATAWFLGKELVGNKPAAHSSKDVEAAVQVVIERTRDRDITAINPEMKFLAAATYLADLGYCKIKGLDKAGNPVLDNPRMTQLLKARCGFPTMTEDKKPIKELIAIHRDAVEVTLQALGLDSQASIEAFNLKIEALSNEVSDLVYQVTESPTFFSSDEQDPTCSLHETFLTTCSFI